MAAPWLPRHLLLHCSTSSVGVVVPPRYLCIRAQRGEVDTSRWNAGREYEVNGKNELK